MRFPASLRSRLLLSTCAIALLALFVVDFSVYASLHSFLYRQIDTNLAMSHVTIERSLQPPPENSDRPGAPLANPPGGRIGPQDSFCGQVTERAPGLFVQIRANANSISQTCPGIGLGGTKLTPQLPKAIPGLISSPFGPSQTLTYFNAPPANATGPNFRVGVSELPEARELIVAVPISPTDATLRQLLWIELFVSAGALLASLLLGWWLIYADLRPLRAVERAASAMGGGDFSDRIEAIDARSEVGRVASAINTMADGIVRAFSERDRTEAELRESEARLRRFVSDASHELRTPIAAISAYAQLFQRGAVRSEEELGRAISGIEHSSARMARLVEDLLYLARLDEHARNRFENAELVGIAAEMVDIARTVGPEWNFALDASEPVFVHGDPAALRQVLENLLSNVRAHTPPSTHATVRVTCEGATAIIEVSDDGPGFAPGEADRLFERFYRTDTSRSRQTGGAGLGLSIVHSIVTKHEGTVIAKTHDPHGATFEVRLPALDACEDEDAPKD